MVDDLIVLPPHRLRGNWRNGESVDGFDFPETGRILRQRGFRVHIMNLNRFPLNPLFYGLPCGDLFALTEAIKKLRDDAEFRVRLAKAARTYVAERHSNERAADQIQASIQRLHGSATITSTQSGTD